VSSSRYSPRTAIPIRPLRVAILDTSSVSLAALQAISAEHGWTSDCCGDYPEMLDAVERGQADLLIIDHDSLPAPEEELSRLYQLAAGPIVVLCRSDESLMSSLRAGATLVVRRPFDPELMSLAIEAMLDRGLALRALLRDIVRIGDMQVHLTSHTVERDGRRQVLSNTEWQLFAVLLGHPGRIYTRDELSLEAWGAGYAGRRAQIELYISRLRRKVERDPRSPLLIETVRHLGYRLGLAVSPVSVSGAEAAPDVLREDGHDVPAAQLDLWIAGYRDLVGLKLRLHDRLREVIARAQPGAHRTLMQADLRLMEPEMDRFQQRLAFWEARRRELNEVHAT
jgi:two-component system response regulator MtrA